MYAELIFKNAKRSVKDYLIYIVTMTICVTLFYSFLSISSKYYQPDIGSGYDLTLLSDGMKIAICLITLCLLFLIRFVDHYMLRRRQKEFAVQAIIGMEQKTIAGLFFAETLIMGMVSIGLGIILGAFCSQFITAMLLTSYGKDYALTWTLFPDTVLLTVGFFAFSFLVVGVSNSRTLQKTKIIDMLSADRENDTELKKSRWIVVIVIFFELFNAWAFVVGITKALFFYDARFALPVQFMYLGNILFPAIALGWLVLWLFMRKKWNSQKLLCGLLICSVLNAFAAASVPALTNRYYLPLGNGMLRQYLLFALIDLLYFVCALIYLIGIFITAWKVRSPEHRYKGENLFFFGQIISRLNTTSKTMTIICITLVVSIFLFISAPILTGWASGYLDIRSMYDVQIFSDYNNVYEEKELPQDNYEIVSDLLQKHDIKASYDCIFDLYLPRKEDFHQRIKYDFPAVAISLSDYNTIRKMLGYEQISLGENEFTTQWQTITTEKKSNTFLKENTTVITDEGILTLSSDPHHKEAIGETVYNSYTNVLYVFPDKICEKLLPVMKNRYIITTEPISYPHALELEKVFTAEYPEQADTGVSFGIRLSTLQINSTKAGNFVLQASMLYGAIVLIVICLTVLSLQQLSDAGQYKYRFSVLRKLGVEEQRITKLILKQLGVWFGLPVIVAIAVTAVIFAYFIQTISAEISAYIGLSTLMLQIGATVGILAILLVCYFISTWILFRNSIHS